jgi:mRNA-degrading endonuclease RelE of RelBE toxin-antitoxin system
LSRHAKNELRALDATLSDVEKAIADPIRIDSDLEGRPRYTSYIRGIRVRIVVAVDEPDLVVTIHERGN